MRKVLLSFVTKSCLLFTLCFIAVNAIGQTSESIQRKIDSLQAEKSKIDAVNNPIIIEKLQRTNDSLNSIKNRLLKQIESINQDIEKNSSKILELKLNIPVSQFVETKIVSKGILPFKLSATYQSKIEYWIPANSTLLFTDIANDEWVVVKHEGKTGYVFASFLDSYPEIISQVKRITQQKTLLKSAGVKYNSGSTYSGSSYTPSSPSYSSDSYSPSSSGSSSRTIYTGPRGGRYYINSNGNKTYIKRR